MSNKFELSAGYPGDSAWKEYVAALSESWENTKDKASAVSICGSLDVAIVLSYIIGEDRIQAWLQQPLPALGGEIPQAFLNRNSKDRKTLRSLLMRMPV